MIMRKQKHPEIDKFTYRLLLKRRNKLFPTYLHIRMFFYQSKYHNNKKTRSTSVDATVMYLNNNDSLLL